MNIKNMIVKNKYRNKFQNVEFLTDKHQVWTCLRMDSDRLHKEPLRRARKSMVKKQEAHIAR